MILLDAYAVVALLRDEQAAGAVEAILRGKEPVGLVSVNLAEALDALLRREQLPRAEVEAAVAPLLQETVEVVAVGEVAAWRAAELRARHYRRRTTELSLADCLLLAVATEGHAIATADQPIQRAATAEGIAVVVLR